MAPAATQKLEIQATVKDPESGRMVKGNLITVDILKVLDTFLEIPKSCPKCLANNRALLSHRPVKSLRSKFNYTNREDCHCVSLQSNRGYI